MSEDQNNNNDTKEIPKYEAPTIKVVRLDTEVMLKTNCKIIGGADKAGNDCNTGGGGQGCANNQAGS